MSAQRRVLRGECGFTLIEMMVTLAILGMLSGLVLSAIKAGMTTMHRAEDSQAATDQVVAAQERLRLVVELMRPEKRLNAPGDVVDIEGSEHDLAFFAPAQAAEAPDQLKRYRMLLTATGDLVLYQANGLDDRIDLDAPELVGWQPITLLHGVTQVSLAYFGENPMNSGRGWQVRWQGRSRVPDLVRIDVDFADGDRRRWPEQIIHPSATSNAPCQLDESGRCKAS